MEWFQDRLGHIVGIGFLLMTIFGWIFHKRVLSGCKRLKFIGLIMWNAQAHHDVLKSVPEILAVVKRTEEKTDKQTRQLSIHREIMQINMDARDLPNFFVDLSGEIKKCSHMFCQRLGMSDKDSCIGYGWIGKIDPDHQRRVRQEWDAGVKDQRDFEIQIVTRGPWFLKGTMIVTTVRDSDTNEFCGWQGVLKMSREDRNVSEASSSSGG